MAEYQTTQYEHDKRYNGPKRPGWGDQDPDEEVEPQEESDD